MSQIATSCNSSAIISCTQAGEMVNYGNDMQRCVSGETTKCQQAGNFGESPSKGALGLPTQTGLKVIDDNIRKVVAWEQSTLSNPIIQVALLGLAGYGIYVLFTEE